MKQAEFSGEVSEYQGQPVSPAIQYSGNADSYETKDEAVTAGMWPDNADSFVLKAINTKSLTAAKQAEYQKVTKDLKDAYEKSPAKQRKDFIEAFLKAPGATQEKAEAVADSIGLTGK